MTSPSQALSRYIANDGLLIRCGPDSLIRPLSVDDVTITYVDGLNDPKVNRYMEIGKGPPQSLDEVLEYVHAQTTRADACLFGLFINDVLRGTCRLHNLTEIDADIGVALFDKSIWGQGWGSRLISAITDLATIRLGCPCLKAGIENDNTSSKRAFAKAGYKPVPLSAAPMNQASWRLWTYKVVE